jgi:hypothetical protein
VPLVTNRIEDDIGRKVRRGTRVEGCDGANEGGALGGTGAGDGVAGGEDAVARGRAVLNGEEQDAARGTGSIDRDGQRRSAIHRCTDDGARNGQRRPLVAQKVANINVCTAVPQENLLVICED